MFIPFFLFSTSFVASKPVKVIGLVAAFALVGVVAVSIFSQPKVDIASGVSSDASKLELASASCPVLAATKDFDVKSYVGHWYTIQGKAKCLIIIIIINLFDIFT